MGRCVGRVKEICLCGKICLIEALYKHKIIVKEERDYYISGTYDYDVEFDK